MEEAMATNLAIDDKLIMAALKAGRHKTKKEAVTAALEAYVAHMKQMELIRQFGRIEFDPSYDYKKSRKI
jgi:Arc/MetJ family transcription regulator